MGYFDNLKTGQYRSPAQYIQSRGFSADIPDRAIDHRKINDYPAIVKTAWSQFSSTPFDGQEETLYWDTSASGGDTDAYWRFRFNDEDNRWWFVGGSRIFNRIDTYETTSSTSWTDLSTAGPDITVPYAGVYHVDFGCGLLYSSGGAGGLIYGVGLGTGWTSASTKSPQTNLSTNERTNGSHSGLVTVVTELLLRMKYKYWTGADSGGFQDRFMCVAPIYVNGLGVRS